VILDMSVNLKNIPTNETPKKSQVVAEQSKNWNVGQAQKLAEKSNSDTLRALEIQLKEIWSQYISYLDSNGFDETAESLKNKYFRLYQNYQRNKNWRNVVINN
jgi:hypothetical protein